MKAKKLITVLTTVFAGFLLTPAAVLAESLDTLNQQEDVVKQQSSQISLEVQLALTDANNKYAEIDATQKKIAANEATLADTQAQIKKTEETIAKRKEAMAKRMQSIQLKGSQNDWTQLLDSANLQEFVSRAYAMTFIQNLEKEKITSLAEERQELETLKATLETTQQELADNQAALETDSQELAVKVADLKQKLADNNQVLSEIAHSKEVETARLAAEKAAAEKAAADAAAAEAAKEQTQQNQGSTGEAKPNEPSTPSTPSQPEKPSNPGSGETSGGKVYYMQSTAYSWTEPGASMYAANGMNLKENPMCVAVDPAVIPLGSLVYVEGYGLAVAADTGGAIKGMIIDVHMKTVDECKAWGRRFNVKVTVQ